MKKTFNEISLLLKAGYKLIHFCSQEEQRSRQELIRIAKEGQRERDIFFWKMTDGFKTADLAEAKDAAGTDKPDKAMQWIVDREQKNCKPSIYVFVDLHHNVSGRNSNALVIRKLKDTVNDLERTLSAIVLLSGPQLEIPAELEKEIVIVDFEFPTVDELTTRFTDIVNEYRSGITINLVDPERGIPDEKTGITELAKAAKGLTMSEAELALGKAITEDKVLDLNDIQSIVEEKKQIVRKTGILTFETQGEMSEVGGLEQLKHWLTKRQNIFSEDATKYGLLPPKGVLLTGVPGCGKSLCSKAMASFWNIPILRLDMGAIYGGLVGQSEANIRKAIRCAEAMAPCILMIDEIEKGMAGASGSGGDGGTGTRVFGALLTWMSDQTAGVFIVATANEFDKLPPEMLRKGRFDEIFFVDFPHAGEREQIFKIHVNKALLRKKPALSDSERKKFVESFGFDKAHEITKSDKDGRIQTLKGTLSQLSKEYTGSEIEEAVKSAMIDAFADGKREFTAHDVAKSLASTVPLIDTMSDRIEKIRAKARECAVAASMGADLDESPTVIEKETVTVGTDNKPSYGGRRIDL